MSCAPMISTLLAASLAANSAAYGSEHELAVKASAFNSVAAQTDGNPALTAWGDVLEPDMKAIAVSRDLIEMGLTHGTRVTIEGLEGEYVVMDKMAARWKKKIDVYMGVDVEAARRWGIRDVTIRWSDGGS